MNYLTRIAILSTLISTALVTGCASTPPYNYEALLAASPRSIVVIPPKNNTVEVDAPYIYLSTISRPLAEKGYYVFPVAVIDNFMKENGLPTPEEMNNVPLDKIYENIGADAVLYVNINQWGQKYNVVSSKAMVSVSMKLVDARTGNLLWDGAASVVKDPGASGGGLVGMLVSAVANQIVGSISDATPQLARAANETVLNAPNQGLLKGPYAPVSNPK
ncbi:DUF799 domain-containing protein [Thalassolituus sp.]|jgi:hypothetical protein|uniref:DUF799 domain-containing protein n=1 Tax=Thalassolituus sp. TaxID=2030822 RepID=UPI002A80E9BB|nr:GNA1162 family protein [Thalassolituus sp.]|tara:strand:+ start:404 stop:1057 length:654 start_codon:yes stop_codon:yes gene_type:complete